MSADSPTPAAPAGSGEEWDDAAKAVARLAEGPDAGWGIWRDWLRSHLTGPGPGNLNVSCPGLDRERAAREAAERERDTISCNAIPTWPACEDGLDRQQHNDPVCWGCYSAEKAIRREVESQLAASTEREAGLRKLCEEALEEVYSAFAAAVILASPPSIVNPAFRAEELWAFAKARNSRDALRARLASLAAPEGGTR